MASTAEDNGSSAGGDPFVVSLERPRKPVILHELGAGAPCLSCGDKCPGLELHFWRKMCKSCKCRLDEHDVQKGLEDPGQIRVGRLFDHQTAHMQVLDQPLSITVHGQHQQGRVSAGSAHRWDGRSSASSPLSTGHAGIDHHSTKIQTGQSDPSPNGVAFTLQHMELHSGSGGKVPPPVAAKPHRYSGTQWTQTDARELSKFAWVPPGADPQMVREYMDSLPSPDRPVTGTDGEIKRRRLIEEQVPLHDIDPEKCTGLDKTDQPAMERYIKSLKNKVVGMGRVERVCMVQRERADKLDGKMIEACTGCEGSLSSDDVAVFCERGPPETAFHPACFRCHGCKELLTDLIHYYNHKNGKLYCGRHFGDLLYPRCSGCDELIFSEQYTLAEGRNYHLSHFCCFGCDKPLGGHRYMHREPHVFCIECYMQRHAHVCVSCGEKIAPDTMRIDHKDCYWHANEKCFRCRQCSKCLVNQHFVIKNKLTFCSVECKRENLEKSPAK